MQHEGYGPVTVIGKVSGRTVELTWDQGKVGGAPPLLALAGALESEAVPVGDPGLVQGPADLSADAHPEIAAGTFKAVLRVLDGEVVEVRGLPPAEPLPPGAVA